MASYFITPTIKVECDVNDESPPVTASCRRSLLPAFLPPSKRIKLENKSTNNVETRASIVSYEKCNLEHLKNSYYDNITEQCYLLNGGNIVDLQLWIKKFPSELVEYLKSHKLFGDLTLEQKYPQIRLSNVNLNHNEEHSPRQVGMPRTDRNDNIATGRVRNSLGADATLGGPPEQIAEKAKQEVSILQRISTLRKDGLWGEKRLPKVQEPPRPKAHWDYLIEEMVWLSADFAQERKWKKAAAKKCAKMVQKYFQDKALLQQKAQKEQEVKLRKTASFVAKEIRIFWNNIEKIIEYKINTRLDEKKKIALDQHLNFIVDQTEKYSTMLAESMKRKTDNNSSINSEASRSTDVSDDEFKPNELSDDDEATIGKEDDIPEEQASELKLLQEESEKTYDDLLSMLPKEYFTSQEVPSEGSDVERSAMDSDPDEEFVASEMAEDDEDTINEQEQVEGPDNYDQEIKELEDENLMSIEELKAKYERLASESQLEEMDVDEPSDSMKDDHMMDEYASATTENDGSTCDLESSILSDDDDDEDNLGLQELVDHSFEDNSTEKCNKANDKDLEDATAVAESLQPKGFTLSSTSVTTPVPFLLKHTLREYQHVGLDWLVTMYEKELNGILADEMGLGKTIQTIALLAHLACEKKSWGPHLIVVPTSVMLNWEMEIKKWCPAFKILTYYGTQKERRLKRQGWTKQNAFHICITSYKLVIQDHQSFRRKKWCYFILDEAQNIKNFKSQRWQLLLNFQSQRRLLLTGTPLQNNLMELWSLMHFLRSDLFASHRDFRELFSNPVTGMIEGNKEYNDTIIKKLHKVLRPFILRRLKCEVEQQMPKKYEHIIMCRLSKRQRFLYEEFMSRTKTKETLSSGNFLNVINILMQLRKVCNHPNLFETRPIISPFMMGGISYECPSVIWGLCEYDPFKHINMFSLNLMLSHLEKCLTAFAAHRMRRFQVPIKLIEEIDSAPELPPKCPAGRIRLHVRPSSQPIVRPGTPAPGQRSANPPVLTLKTVNQQPTAVNANNIITPQSTSQWPTGVRFQLVQYGGSYKAIPLPPGSTGGMVVQSTPQGARYVVPHKQLSVATTSLPKVTATPHGGTVSMANNTSASSTAVTGGLGSLQLVQTSVGNYLVTSTPIQKSANNSTTSSVGVSSNTAMALLQRLQSLKGLQGSVITTGAGGRPVLRLPTSPLRPTPAGTPVTPVPVSILNTPITKVPAALQATQQNTHVKLSSAVPQSTLTYSTVGAPSLSQGNKQHIKENQIDESKSKVEGPRSIFYMGELEEARKTRRKEKLKFLAKHNTRHCHACPIYGGDLIEAVNILLSGSNGVADINGIRSAPGLTYSRFAPYPTTEQFWSHTRALQSIVNTPMQRLDACRNVLDKFVFCVPAALSPRPQLRLHHPCPSKLWKEKTLKISLQTGLRTLMKPLHSIASATVTQFPDPRLIQYDCGKLQRLNVLLRTLKMGAHRVLIFTQMTKMLDVFEAFLNYHGHLYLRLDGTTKVEQRQILMERFNQDKRIFVFILSTRSGGIGVNLTGADTVIFYDSDWNPTMDAQAQDRCHRIGQTRDVHIYRLISERTVEENILKKANQKKLLGDLAIEGGKFTASQLKKQTIHDLFEVDLQEQDASKRMSEVISNAKDEGTDEGSKMGAYESALAAAEDESDVQAAKTAKAEAAAHLAEFDENIPLDEAGGEEVSKVEHELSNLMKQLNPIEKYAMKFLEDSDACLTAEAERIAAEIEQQKKEWEQSRLTMLNEEQQRQQSDSGDEQLTYSSVDARNKVWMSFDNEQVMSVWQPLTPPRNDNDRYMEEKQDQWYESIPMEESSLPSIYMTRENKRIKLDPDAISGTSMDSSLRTVQRRNDDLSAMPRSMFDTPSSLVFTKAEKMQMVTRTHISTVKLIAKVTETDAAKGGFLDLFIANVVSLIDSMVTNSMISSYCPTNWDLVADVVNISDFIYRSSRSTRSRYDALLTLNDERDITEHNSKKIWKKMKTICMRSNSVGVMDSNIKFSKFVGHRFENVRDVAMRTVCTKPVFLNTNSKNKHAGILQDYGLNYDDPVAPKSAAVKRAERLKKVEQKNELLNRSTGQSQTCHQVLEPTAVSVAGFTNKQVTNLVSQGDVSNIASGSNSPNLSIASSAAGATVLSNVRATVTGHVQAGQGGRTTVTFQDLQGRTGTSQATVVSVASLAQLQVAKLAGSLSTQNVHQKGVAVPVQARALTPQQMQLLRQQAQRQTIALQSTKVVSTSTTVDGQTIKRVQIAGGQSGANQKLQVAVSGGSMPGITAIQVSQAGRAQLIKSGSVVAVSGPSTSGTMGKNVARTVTESEMNAILRRAPHQITKAGNLAQMLAKQRPLVNMKGATVGLLGSKTGVTPGTLGTVQIVQAPTTSKHMTVHQLQQAFKQGAIAGTIIGKAVVSSANCNPANALGNSQASGIVQATMSSSPTTKLIPMSVSPQPQNIKQTIQVVSAGSSASTSNSVRVTANDRPSGLTLQGNTVRVANPALLSQVSAALQGPISVAVRAPGTNPIRIDSSQTSSPQNGSNQQQFNQ